MNHRQLLRLSLFGSLGLGHLACGGATLGDVAREEPACSSPESVPGDTLVRCGEGYTHRPTAATCGSGDDQSALPRATNQSCELGPEACDAFQYGYCATGQGGPLCQSGCRTDQDCGDRGLCLCGGASASGFGVCEGGTCRTDDDCQPGYRCASYTVGCGGGYACQTPQDTCTSDSDCRNDQSCQPQEDGHRACAGLSICGRPFLVASRARLAPIVRRGDWLLQPLAT
jgi:hypothetical protein